jgi:glycerophosphoryl diester phosphodiesterase
MHRVDRSRRPGAALVAAVAVTTLAVAAPATAPEPTTAAAGAAPFVSAHRGGAAYAPENTMVAFRNAVRLGVDQLEADTQLTADGALVVIHDDTVDRTTDCSGTVAAMTLAELRGCDAAYWFSPGQPTTVPDDDASHPLRDRGVRIPTADGLLAYLARTPGVELSLEIKDIPGEANFDVTGTAVAEALVPRIQAHGLVDRVVVQSFWPAAIETVKRLDPRVRTQLLTTSSTGQTGTQNLAYVTARGHDVMAPNHDAPDLTREVVDAAHAAGADVVVWTPDRPDHLRAATAVGVDGIITNFPGCLLDLQDRRRPGRLLPGGAGPDLDAACPADTGADGPRLPDDRPSPAECAALRPSRWAPAVGQAAPGAQLRTVAIQFKQDVRHVTTYEAFRTKMRCLMEEHVVPVMRPGLPLLVVYNEDIGLMTLGVGSRGRPIREQAATPLRAPLGDDVPAGAAAALAQVNATYAPQVAAYQARFGPIDPRKQVFVAATDTFVRAFMQTFADIARDYGVHVVATNNQAPYRASRDPAEIALFADPDLGPVDEVYVATAPRVTNTTFLWGPTTVDPDAPAGMRNLVFANHKVPITDLERDLIGLDEGPATGPEARANAAGAEVAGLRLGFATSLPAFRWGYDFGERPDDLAPCADVRTTYMPCMDALGVDVVVQAEANPGRWAHTVPGGWQPLEWMESTWRSVADPTVGFRFNVTAHLVGNLFDIPFDGQSAITARGAAAAPARYVGNGVFEPGRDAEAYRVHVGDKREFLVLADWVVPDDDRDVLRAVAAALAPGSGDPRENDYLETAVWADLADTVTRAAPPAAPKEPR